MGATKQGSAARAKTVLPCHPTSVPAARRFVRSALRRIGGTQHLDVAVLLTSELATNAVLHARSDFELRVSADRDSVRVETTDESPSPPIIRGTSAETPGGNGMVLVSRLASTWGYQPTEDGKVVWFELGPANGSGRER